MTEMLIILALILVNGVFAMSEIAVISSRKLRLKSMARRGSRGARAALALTESPTRFLSTIQIGITLVGIIAGAFGEATIARHLEAYLRRFPLLAPHAAGLSFTVVVAVIAYLSLVLGELIPKRIAMLGPERTASVLAGPMRLLSTLASPLVSLLSVSTDTALRLMRVRATGDHAITEEEFKGLMDEGTRAGVLEKAETDMMRNVLRLGNRSAGDVMTPRPDIVWLDIADPVPDLLREVMDSPFSRFPVAQGNIDNLLGVLDAKTLLRPCAGGSPPDIQALLRKPLVVPETMPALNLLAEFRQSEIPFALVADEFGSILGVVTTDDVLQSILGDLGGATADDGERACVVRADGSWLIAGFMPVDEMRDTLQLDPLPGEEEGHYRTMAGFVMYQLGHLPTAGEAFEHAGLRFEVVDMDANRVDKVLVAPAASLPGEAGPGNGHP